MNRYIKISLIGLILCTHGRAVIATGIPDVLPPHLLIREESDPDQLYVVDEYGKPVVGAKVYSSGNELLGTTDDTGLFKLSPEPIDTKVLVKHPAYFPAIVDTGIRKKIVLVTSYRPENEFVDIPYAEKKADHFLGSATVLYHREIKGTPSSLYLNALTGRIPGLYTQEISGFRSARTDGITSLDLAGSLPTDATKYNSGLSDNSEIAFNVRGQNPVTIIDGVQRDLFSIDPESIESVTVAKDALSSILLGQRSSRGVLQITTKKGKVGPPRVSFTAQTGIQQSLKLPKAMDAFQYAYLYNEALLNAGRQPVFSAAEFDAYRNGTDPLMFPNVNWYDVALQNNSPISKYNLSVNGGVKNARYALSLSYLDQLGMFQESNEFNYPTNLQNQRYLINSSIDLDVTEDLTLGLQLFGRIQEGRQPGAGTAAIMSGLYNTPNNAYPIFNPDGSYGGSSVYRTNLHQQVTGSGYLLDNNRDLLANLDFKYDLDKFLPGLYLMGKANVSAASSSIVNRNRMQPVYDVRYNDQQELVYVRYGDIADQPNSFETTSTANFYYFQGALGYDREIGPDHQLSTRLFFDRQNANYQFDLPAIYTNIAGQASYAYQNRYFAELAVNYSGFNRFAPGNKYGLFYAFGLGWNLLEEQFFDDWDWLSTLKLRSTYGRTGNTNEAALGYYSWRASYGQDGANGYEFGSEYGYVNGLVEKGLANTEGTWEKGDKFNIGLDVAFWDSRFQITADYFRDTYFDLLQQRGSTIDLIGIQYPTENIGSNRYEGQELSLSFLNRWGKFNYFIKANATRMRTEVLYMNEVYQKYDWNRRTGMPVGQPFGYLADGLIQSQEEADNAPLLAGNEVFPGDVKLLDLNEDGLINSYDQTAIGNIKPMIYYGLTVGFNVVGFDMNVLLQGVMNRTYQQTDYSFGSNGEGQGFDYLLGRWTPERGVEATYPRLTLGADPTNTPAYTTSSYWTKPGKYMRIRHVDIGYTLPREWTNRARIATLRVFLNAQNLFTFTPFDRLDPEVNGSMSYPAQRIISFGLHLKL